MELTKPRFKQVVLLGRDCMYMYVASAIKDFPIICINFVIVPLQVKVRARDGGDPPRVSSEADVTINVGKNREKPVFQRLPYRTTIRQNLDVGSMWPCSDNEPTQQNHLRRDVSVQETVDLRSHVMPID